MVELAEGGGGDLFTEEAAELGGSHLKVLAGLSPEAYLRDHVVQLGRRPGGLLLDWASYGLGGSNPGGSTGHAELPS